MKKICIVTTRHISYNPRVLKEADTLHQAGYKVSVVTVNNHSVQRSFDEDLMRTRKWTLLTVNFRREVTSERYLWLYLSIKHKLFAVLARLTFKMGIAERAINKAYDHLLRKAKQEQADLYIVHHPEALGIGFRASQANRSKFAYDAEDFHTGMSESVTSFKEEKNIAFVEKKYLPYCNYITAASKGIGEAYIDKYAIGHPVTILNVFPKVQLTVSPVNNPVRFYWYSQVIGPNRSLELLLAAASEIKEPFEIHLRGSFQNGQYKHTLLQLIDEYHLHGKIFFHQPILAEDIIPDACQFDVGLALESAVSLNRKICVTNKSFSYLMSGLAIIATDTYGQKDILSPYSEVAYICETDNKEALVNAMLFYINQPGVLLKAKHAARNLAEDLFNWEEESKKFLRCVREVLESSQEVKHAYVSQATSVY